MDSKWPWQILAMLYSPGSVNHDCIYYMAKSMWQHGSGTGCSTITQESDPQACDLHIAYVTLTISQ